MSIIDELALIHGKSGKGKEVSMQKPTVLIVGCFGDCAGRARAYNRTTIEMLRRAEISALVLTDIGGLRDNIRQSPSLSELKQLMSAFPVSYCDGADKEVLKRGIDIAFLMPPNDVHLPFAANLLQYLNKGGLIVVEKPLADSLRSALLFQNHQPEAVSGDLVVGHDHFLGHFAPMSAQSQELLPLIGTIIGLEFNLLEVIAIPSHRVQTLDEGMGYDLGPHALAVIGALASGSATPDVRVLETFIIRGIRAASYTGCRISGPTFVQIQGSIEFPWLKQIVPVTVNVGKAIGWADNKSVIITGEKGQIIADRAKLSFRVVTSEGEEITRGSLNNYPTETMLKQLIVEGVPPMQTSGILTYEAAAESMAILDEAARKIRTRGSYFPAATIEEIIAQSEDLCVVKRISA